MSKHSSFLFFLLIFHSSLTDNWEFQELNNESFPDDFIFGTGSSAYQTEGAWNEDGKGVNIWDHMTHTRPEKIADGSSGDIACDSYNKIDDDIALLKNLGVDHYRFSLSWSRILPTGLPDNINNAGLGYYNNLINKLLESNIKPMVTIFHWDLPQPLENMGGFTNSSITTWFKDFARVVLDLFGDRVKLWTTFNEPKQICSFGYGRGIFAPGIEEDGVKDYICIHNLLKAHAEVYHMYHEVYKPIQKGQMGIVIECGWFEPATNSTVDIEAAERKIQFDCGLYANAIFSENGDYPEVVKNFIAIRSKAEGYQKSRLPTFTKNEIEYIRGTSDYFGLNHYLTYMVEDKEADPIGKPSLEKDTRVKLGQDPKWPVSAIDYFRSVPRGFRKILKWIKYNYGNPVIYVTENGMPDKGTLNDKARIDYHLSYLSNLLDAVHVDKVNVKGYFLWSFLDYFEWKSGYTVGFGLHYVNYSDPKRPRLVKDSAKAYAKIIREKKIRNACSINSKNKISVTYIYIIFMSIYFLSK